MLLDRLGGERLIEHNNLFLLINYDGCDDWLATTKAPGRMGTAIKAQMLDVDGPLARKFADWLRRLFA